MTAASESHYSLVPYVDFDTRPDHPRQVCNRCIMDTSVPEIVFDEKGVCQFCHMHDSLESEYPPTQDARHKKLLRIVEKIKAAGKGKRYDVICGTSGGRDSTFVLYTAVKLGLRPLAVHFDNGWNSEIAVMNIKNACDALDVDLETVVADWHEFRELQVAFLKSSTPDVEVPTDVAIHTVMHRLAAQEGVKYIFNGHSFRNEGISPLSWTCIDGRYIDSVYTHFFKKKLRDFPNFRIPELIKFSLLSKIKVIPILNYVEYEHKKVQPILERELGWRYYGGHHHESYYTKFIQSYLLPQKFNIDKRKTELSAFIRSGRVTRDEALDHIRTHPYSYDERLTRYVVRKLELTQKDWDDIWALKPKSFRDYPNYLSLMRFFRLPIRIACQIGLLPKLLYLKYLAV